MFDFLTTSMTSRP